MDCYLQADKARYLGEVLSEGGVELSELLQGDVPVPVMVEHRPRRAHLVTAVKVVHFHHHHHGDDDELSEGEVGDCTCSNCSSVSSASILA